MNVLAIDPSMSLGWAVSGGASGVLDLRPFKGDLGEMAFRFRQWIAATLRDRRIDLLVIERPFAVSAIETAILPAHLAWTAHEVAFVGGVAREEVAASKWRKEVFGPGRWPTARAKKRALEWCHANFVEPISDHNEAEARCILAWYLGRPKAIE